MELTNLYPKEKVCRLYIRTIISLDLMSYLKIYEQDIDSIANNIILYGPAPILYIGDIPSRFEDKVDILYRFNSMLIKPFVLDFFKKEKFNINTFILFVNEYNNFDYELNLDDYICYIYKTKGSIKNLISSAFYWRLTPQGFKFFEDMHYRYISYIDNKF